MTKEKKATEGRRGFSWFNLRSACGYPAFFQIALLSAIIFQLKTTAEAQANLVDLYNWTDESAPIQGLIDVYSSNSATFLGNYGNFPAFNHLNLSGNVATTPGATYDVSFTLQDASYPGDFDGAGNVWFGTSESNLDYAFEDGYLTNGGYVFPAVNYNFIAMASSSTTSISFGFALDEGLNADLSNFMITEVPEISTIRLLYYGGCMFLLAKQLRKVTRKQKLAVKAKA